MRLSDQAIRSIPTPSQTILISDDELRGFAVRITSNNVRSFTLTYRVDGRQRRLTIGRWPTWTATAARKQARELRRAVDRGEDPLGVKEQRRAAPTVAEVVRQYLDRHAAQKKTGHTDRLYLERDVVPVWGSLKAAEIKKRDVLELVERKALTAPIAGNMLLAIIKGVWGWAIEKDLVQDNPAYRVKPPSKRTPRDRWLNDKELKTVWEGLVTAKMSPECKTALRLILLTAQRPGEILNAEWTEMDLDVGWWVIPREKAKSAIQHGVPLTATAINELQSLPRVGRWVIRGWWRDGRAHLTGAGLSNAVIANREHFGIPQWTPHDLRRTTATHMARAGVDRFIIARVLGHSDKTITATYERYTYDREKRQALERWERRLRQIITGEAGKVVSIG